MNAVIGFATAFFLTIAAPAWAINKCTSADGRVVFQDAPCMGKGEKLSVHPASGPAASQTISSDGTKVPTEAERLRQQVAESQKERRKTSLMIRLIPDMHFAIAEHRAQCEASLTALRDKKSRANNNLAGAVWEQSISSEMTAISTRCDTRSRELAADLKTLQDECRSLGCSIR